MGAGNDLKWSPGPVASADESFPRLTREYVGQLVCGTSRGRAIVVERMRAAAYEKGPRAQKAARAAMADTAEWMRRSGPWKVFLLGAVGLVALAALGALATFLVLFVTATANAILISFMLSVSVVGFLMASCFTSLTAVYVGALLAAGVIISAITFFSICGMIMAAVWFAFSWGVWSSLKRILQFSRGSVALVASALASLSGAGSTKIIAIQKGT